MHRFVLSIVVLLALASAGSAADIVELHSVVIENGEVRVEYSKNFVTCAHLYREATNTITHFQNLFCESGDHVVKTNPEELFRRLMVGERVYLIHGNNAGIRSATVTITRRPVADAGPNQVVDCIGGGAIVELDGSFSFDPDSDDLFFEWSVPAGVVLDDPTSETPIGAFPIGVTTVTLTVTDENGAVDVDDVVIAVVDETPPVVMCTTDLAALSPANGKLVPVEVYIDATDFCTAPDQLRLVSVTIESDEPDDARGNSDGRTTGDTNGEDGFTAPVDVTGLFEYNADTESFEAVVFLRAERDKRGFGRTYSINAVVIDSADNFADSSCAVVVPKGNKGKKGKNK